MKVMTRVFRYLNLYVTLEVYAFCNSRKMMVRHNNRDLPGDTIVGVMAGHP